MFFNLCVFVWGKENFYVKNFCWKKNFTFNENRKSHIHKRNLNSFNIFFLIHFTSEHSSQSFIIKAWLRGHLYGCNVTEGKWGWQAFQFFSNELKMKNKNAWRVFKLNYKLSIRLFSNWRRFQGNSRVKICYIQGQDTFNFYHCLPLKKGVDITNKSQSFDDDQIMH